MLRLSRLSAGHYQVKSHPNIYIDRQVPEESRYRPYWNIVIDDESFAGADTLRDARDIIRRELTGA